MYYQLAPMKAIVCFFSFIFPFLTLGQPNPPAVPEFNAPTNLEAWKKERVTIRNTLTQVMGNVPPRPTSTDIKILSREDKGSYTLERFEFMNGAGAVVPGYMLIPKAGKTPFPAVYYCHWHGGNYDLGKEEIFTTHHTPEVPAEALIKAGYAVMATDAYCFGERSGKGPGGPHEKGGPEELTTSKRELWFGRSLWSMMVRDDLMALDYLFTRPEVDKQRVAVTGISMGATRSWWLMALDERIKTGVAVGCLTRYQDLIAEQKLKAHGIYYFVPGILNHFDSEAIISLIAPKPVLFMTGDEDIGSPVSGIRKIDEKVRPVYALYRKQDAFENIIYPKTGHVYTPDMWRKMLEWMEKHL
jgi:dienelactone hydrolase